MIHSSSNITIIDVLMHNVISSDVYHIMCQQVLYADKRKDHNDPIVIRERNVHFLTQDWTGWTKITGIEINTQYQSDWYKIVLVGSEDRFIIVTGDQLIPLYRSWNQSSKEPEIRTKAFHGEVKFKFDLFRASDIYEMSLNNHAVLEEFQMRVRDIKEEDVVKSQLGRINISLIGRDVNIANFAYKIFTKSDFMNINGFHIWTNDYIPVNLKKFK